MEEVPGQGFDGQRWWGWKLGREENEEREKDGRTESKSDYGSIFSLSSVLDSRGSSFNYTSKYSSSSMFYYLTTHREGDSTT